MAERQHIPTRNRRFVVLHYHILKNAGSTLAAILEREFAGSFVDIDSDSPDGVMTDSELREYLEAHPQITALTSHQIRFPRIESETMITFECCLVRHPLDRLESLYHYSKAAGESTAIGELARKTDLRGFMRELTEHFPHFVCNPQVTHIANGSRFTRPPDEDDLQKAASIMRKISLPGVVHKFNESMVAAEYFLRPAFPKLQLHYEIKNATRPMGRTLSEQEHVLREALGEELFLQLQRLNELDFQLFRAAEKELDRRIDLIPSFDSRMQSFAARCGRVSELSPV